VLVAIATAVAALPTRAWALSDRKVRRFVEQAFEMKRLAEQAGDQPYGAVIVRDEEIVGLAPSRVIIKNDWTAHAEREAIRDARVRLGSSDLSGCVIYSTSRPCSECETAAARAKIARMFYGADAADAGAPRALP
jgi:tRNA(Arg) A34 adenosine deaminase TadA